MSIGFNNLTSLYHNGACFANPDTYLEIAKQEGDLPSAKASDVKNAPVQEEIVSSSVGGAIAAKPNQSSRNNNVNDNDKDQLDTEHSRIGSNKPATQDPLKPTSRTHINRSKNNKNFDVTIAK